MVRVWLDMCDTLETESERINREVIFFGWKFIFRKIYYVYLFMRNFFSPGGSPLNPRKVFCVFFVVFRLFLSFFFFKIVYQNFYDFISKGNMHNRDTLIYHYRTYYPMKRNFSYFNGINSGENSYETRADF